MLETLRSGDWLTAARRRVYPRILVMMLLLVTIAAVAFPNVVGPKDMPLGTDFSQVWVAGKEARAGAPQAPYDLARHFKAQRAEFGENTGLFGWHYPPFFLVPAALLAALPYKSALGVWMVLTLAAYALVIVRLLAGAGLQRREAFIVALSFPAVFINLGHGQNGFLTAALLGAGFLQIDMRPLVSGALFGMLAYKPQFLMILPLALLVERRWSVMIGAAAAVFVMTGASVLAFGLGTWRAFFDSLAFTRLMAEQGATGFEKIQSVFAAARLMGAGVEIAYACQAVVIVGVVVALIRLLRSEADGRVKAAATIIAMFLTTPYILDYDMVALAPALALLLAHGVDRGFAPFEKSIMAAVYAAPLIARLVAGATGLPVGPLTILTLFISTVRQGGRRPVERSRAEA